MSYRSIFFLGSTIRMELFKISRTHFIFSEKFHIFNILSSHYCSKPKMVEFKTEKNLVFLSDPDTFGTLSGKWPQNETVDEGDLKEDEYHENIPLPSQQLSTKQYSDIIKQYVKHKRLKEALDVLEVKMIKEDRVRPENYIYNILIGACADVGYTKKAFKLYNDMKRRGLKVTGDTYTCLFNACANSPWPADGIKNAAHLREIMKEKGIEPNLTNYNSMIKAFGRCGDLSTAFQIVDEMISKKIKIRVHTFNFLLQACITDKNNGLRHAVIVWRKMLLRREKPNIFTFNLMLKCVKECNFGSMEDIAEAFAYLAKTGLNPTQTIGHVAGNMQLEASKTDTTVTTQVNQNCETKELQFVSPNELSLLKVEPKEELIPNLLSKNIQIVEVVSVQEVTTPQKKFEFIGGKSGFLQEMKIYNVAPDEKTIALMVPLVPDTEEAENDLMATIKEHKIRVDIEYYNSLIRKRCFRKDYKSALAVKELIVEENRVRKKKHPMKKKIQLKPNLLTYGCLAMTCATKEDAIKLINEMEENRIKINIEILGAMMSQAVINFDFSYITYIMKTVKEQSLTPNDAFLRHLDKFHKFCTDRMERYERKQREWEMAPVYINFRDHCKRWIKDWEESKTLETDHPWQQFRENQPETVQRQNIIKMPERYAKKLFKYPKPYKV